MTNMTSVAITTPQPLSPIARHYTVTLKSEDASKTKHSINAQIHLRDVFIDGAFRETWVMEITQLCGGYCHPFNFLSYSINNDAICCFFSLCYCDL